MIQSGNVYIWGMCDRAWLSTNEFHYITNKGWSFCSVLYIGCSKTYNTYDPVHLFLKQLVTSIVQAPSLYNFIRKQNSTGSSFQSTSIAIVLHGPFYIVVIYLCYLITYKWILPYLLCELCWVEPGLEVMIHTRDGKSSSPAVNEKEVEQRSCTNHWQDYKSLPHPWSVWPEQSQIECTDQHKVFPKP